jgi:DUF1009 family protein
MPQGISVIVGNGELPIKVLNNIKKSGIEVDVIGICNEYDRRVKSLCRRFREIKFYEIERGIEGLREFGNRDVIFVGGVRKSLMLDILRPDVMIKVLSLKSTTDEDIFSSIIKRIESEGFSVLSFTRFYEEGLVREGVICGETPDERLISDADYGMRFIKHNTDFSTGQSVVVKDENILAVETVFGTDEMLRCLCGKGVKGAILVKASKHSQDLRVDLPSIGKRTVDLILKCHIRWIFIEAERSIIIGDSETIEYARKKGVNICGRRSG